MTNNNLVVEPMLSLFLYLGFLADHPARWEILLIGIVTVSALLVLSQMYYSLWSADHYRRLYLYSGLFLVLLCLLLFLCRRYAAVMDSSSPDVKPVSWSCSSDDRGNVNVYEDCISYR